MADGEVYEAAFGSSPGTNLAGIPVTHLDLPGPFISSGLPYHVACVKHVTQTYKASRLFIIASGSLSRSTDKLKRLIEALRKDNIVGIQKGMTSHSLWSEILSVTAEARAKEADCIITLGAGSITDAAKLVVFVSPFTRVTLHLLTSAVSSQQHHIPHAISFLRPGCSECSSHHHPSQHPIDLYPHHALRRRILRSSRRHQRRHSRKDRLPALLHGRLTRNPRSQSLSHYALLPLAFDRRPCSGPLHRGAVQPASYP